MNSIKKVKFKFYDKSIQLCMYVLDTVLCTIKYYLLLCLDVLINTYYCLVYAKQCETTIMATNMILFENQTYYSVEVLLIESNSRETLMNFGILRPKSLMMANSYETFTWLFRLV